MAQSSSPSPPGKPPQGTIPHLSPSQNHSGTMQNFSAVDQHLSSDQQDEFVILCAAVSCFATLAPKG